MNNYLKMLVVVESNFKPFYGEILTFGDGTYGANDVLSMKLNDDFSFPFEDEAAMKELNYNLSNLIRGVIEEAQKKAAGEKSDE